MRVLPKGDSDPPQGRLAGTTGRATFPQTVGPVSGRQLLVDASLACVALAFSLGALSQGGVDDGERGFDALAASLAELGGQRPR